MRFRGGAVGHRSTSFNTVIQNEEPLNDDCLDGVAFAPANSSASIEAELNDYGYVQPSSEDEDSGDPEADESNEYGGDEWEEPEAEREGFGSYS